MSAAAVHDEAGRRFYLSEDGDDVYVSYRMVNDTTVDFVSTFTPPSLRGRGLARVVVDAGLAWARAQDYGIQASCWYVQKILDEEGAES